MSEEEANLTELTARYWAPVEDDHDRLKRTLFEFATYAPTPRLQGLREGVIGLTRDDVLALYAEFVQGSLDAGVYPTLIDFGNWLAGTEPFETPADVVW